MTIKLSIYEHFEPTVFDLESGLRTVASKEGNREAIPLHDPPSCSSLSRTAESCHSGTAFLCLTGWACLT